MQRIQEKHRDISKFAGLLTSIQPTGHKSAHNAVDFVWRAGGTIAQYAKNGNPVKIIDLTFGQRGESQSVWKSNPGITEDKVAEVRKLEAEAAAKALGADISFYGWKDHLLLFTREMIEQMTADIMDFQPDIVLTHSESDPLNEDHTNTYKAVLAALRGANVSGVFPEKKPTKQVEIYTFEPDEPDVCQYLPDIYIDITDVQDIKAEAMAQIPAQAFMASDYTTRSMYRAALARRFVPGIKYAEAFKRVTPHVGKEF